MFMDRKTQYCQDVSSSQLYLQIQCNPNQNPSKLFCGYQQTDSKVYVGKQKTQNSQHNIEGEQSWRTDAAQVQDLLYSCSTPGSLISVKEYSNRSMKNVSVIRVWKQAHICIVNSSLTKEQKQYNGEKVDLSNNGAETTGRPHTKKNESTHRPYTFHKN